MLRITDVVKHLIILNVIMFFGTEILMGDERKMFAVYYPAFKDYFQPYQLVTHMFMHSDIGHLFFNMFGLYMFGPQLESLWGSKRFLLFYFSAGLGAVAFSFLMMYLGIDAPGAGWGASGALYGVMVGCGMNFPNAKMGIMFLPFRIEARYFIPAILAMDIFGGFFGFSIFGRNIAHFAHVGGAIFGFLMVMYWRKFGSRL